MSTTTTESNIQPSGKTGFPVVAVAAVCAMVGYLPLLVVHFRDLWGNEQYQYFPFVIASVAMLVWTRWKQAGAVTQSNIPGWVPSFLTSAAVAMLLAAVLFWSGWLAAISLILLLASVVCITGRQLWITNFWGIWCLLWLCIPLPLSLGPKLIRSLQASSSLLSSQVLDLLGVKHVMTGNVLEVPTKRFFVDEACSGIVSFMAIIAAGAIYLVFMNRRLVHSITLLVVGVGWAFFLNVSRIIIIAFCFDTWEWDLSTGWQHDVLGLVLFGLTFIAMVSSDRLLEFALAPIQVVQMSSEAAKNPFIRMFNWVAKIGKPYSPLSEEEEAEGVEIPATTAYKSFSLPTFSRPQLIWGLSFFFVAVGLLQVGLVVATEDPNKEVVAHALKIDKSYVPAQLGDWKLEKHEYISREVANEELSDHSHTFQYVNPETGNQVMISLDFAYTGGWHDLCICYTATGWQIDGRNIKDAPEFQYVESNMENEANQFGQVVFGAFDATGKYVTPPGNLITWRPWSALRRRTLKTISPRLLQIQAFAIRDRELTDKDKEDIKALFVECASKLRAHFQTRG